jgi:outer membrane immunogenic protein
MRIKATRAAALALLASIAIAPASLAADLGGAPRGSVKDSPIPYAPAFSWTGVYVGTHAGYAWSDADWQYALSPGVSTGHDGSGWLAGGQIGYNLQLQQFVIGVEADASSAWLDGSTSCPNAAFSCSHSYNWLASVRGRAGVAINGNRTLLYGTAGFAWADVDYAANDVATGAAFATNFSHRHSGWVAGAGIEHMLSQNMTARVEYLYYAFDDVTAPAGTLGAGPAALDATTQTVRFGLNLKF